MTDIEFEKYLNDSLAALLLHHSDSTSCKELLTKSFNYAKEKHKDQKRLSGEPYIVHPIEVAKYVSADKADTDSICAALLHDTLEDVKGLTKKEMLNDGFPTVVVDLVYALTKISSKNKDKNESNMLTINKLILEAVKDPRSIIIKIKDRIHNMKTIDGHPDMESRKRIAKQTLEVFVPITRLLSMYDDKEVLEDTSLEVLHPDEFKHISMLREKYESDQRLKDFASCRTETKLSDIVRSKSVDLVKSDVSRNFSLRFKSKYAIYEELYKKYSKEVPQDLSPETRETLIHHKILETKNLDMFDDIVKLRINTNTEADARLAYYAINSIFGQPSYTRDYIATPAFNGYQAIHSCNFIKEINHKIRFEYGTFRMDAYARKGIATCWNYDYENAVEKMKKFLMSRPFYEDLIELCRIYENSEGDSLREENLALGLITRVFNKRINITFNGDVWQVYDKREIDDFVRSKYPVLYDEALVFSVNGIEASRDQKLCDGDVVVANVIDLELGTQRERKDEE